MFFGERRPTQRPTQDVFSEANLQVLGQIYSGKSIKVFRYAADEARRLGHHKIQSSHLLLGLIREGTVGSDRHFIDRARIAAEQIHRRGFSTFDTLTLGESARRTFSFIKEDSGWYRPKKITPDYLLKALLDDATSSSGARILKRMGVNTKEMFGQVRNKLDRDFARRGGYTNVHTRVA